MAVLAVAQWNIELGRSGFADAKIAELRRLCEDGIELVTLQEVNEGGIELLRRARPFPLVVDSLELRPRRAGEGRERSKGCVVLASGRFRLEAKAVLGPPLTRTLPPAPERTLVARLRDERRRRWNVASFHVVAGRDRKWGPIKKREHFRARDEWLRVRRQHVVVGADLNSPITDHPEVALNGYNINRGVDQEEWRVHGPFPHGHRPHLLRDAFREHLRRDRPALAAALANFDRTAAAQASQGCLAVSHVVRGQKRRFDHIFLSADLTPVRVTYRPITAGSSHAPVLAEIDSAT